MEPHLEAELRRQLAVAEAEEREAGQRIASLPSMIVPAPRTVRWLIELSEPAPKIAGSTLHGRAVVPMRAAEHGQTVVAAQDASCEHRQLHQS